MCACAYVCACVCVRVCVCVSARECARGRRIGVRVGRGCTPGGAGVRRMRTITWRRRPGPRLAGTPSPPRGLGRARSRSGPRSHPSPCQSGRPGLGGCCNEPQRSRTFRGGAAGQAGRVGGGGAGVAPRRRAVRCGAVRGTVFWGGGVDASGPPGRGRPPPATRRALSPRAGGPEPLCTGWPGSAGPGRPNSAGPSRDFGPPPHLKVPKPMGSPVLGGNM
jgi:hypothetical protein